MTDEQADKLIDAINKLGITLEAVEDRIGDLVYEASQTRKLFENMTYRTTVGEGRALRVDTTA